jgi:acylglycerol lipase
MGGTESKIQSRDGTRLHLRHYPAEGEARARLLWVHGFAEHGGRYAETLAWFAQQGFESWILDLRGHGKSEGKQVYLERFSDYLDDMEAYYSHVADGSLPVFGLGHSMGGLVLSRLLEERLEKLPELRGAVILSPFMAMKSRVPFWKAGPVRWLSRSFPRFSVPAPFSTDVLSKDTEIGRAYGADPLISRRARVRWFTETIAAQALAREQAGTVELPVLVMHGLDDGLADVEATQHFFKGIKSADQELKLWDGLRHELLNEIEKQQVREHIAGWLEGRLPGPVGRT